MCWRLVLLFGVLSTPINTSGFLNYKRARDRQLPHRERFVSRHNRIPGAPYSGLMLAVRITLAHFSASSAMNLPNSEGVSGIAIPPKSASRAVLAG